MDGSHGCASKESTPRFNTLVPFILNGPKRSTPVTENWREKGKALSEVSLPSEWCVAAGVACDKLHSL